MLRQHPQQNQQEPVSLITNLNHNITKAILQNWMAFVFLDYDERTNRCF